MIRVLRVRLLVRFNAEPIELDLKAVVGWESHVMVDGLVTAHVAIILTVLVVVVGFWVLLCDDVLIWV